MDNLTWRTLRDKINQLDEIWLDDEIKVIDDNESPAKTCVMGRIEEDLYFKDGWDYACPESDLEEEDKNDPDVRIIANEKQPYLYIE